IKERNDTLQYEGRSIVSLDNGFKSDNHKKFVETPFKYQPRKAETGKNVTQMYYARQGIITKEMKFVAMREDTSSEYV
ncbi:phosphomethylpyrimidine synthase ThiC, partial [Citrobacter freundii]|nr:phosphomethylpyrimidine synthase ThiC [Citrobacter freundii]